MVIGDLCSVDADEWRSRYGGMPSEEYRVMICIDVGHRLMNCVYCLCGSEVVGFHASLVRLISRVDVE